MVLEVRLKKRKNLETIMVSRLFCGAAGQIRTADLILTNYMQAVFSYRCLLQLVVSRPLIRKGRGLFLVVSYRYLL